MKRALRRLRVRDEWIVDTNRNKYEADYLEYVSRIVPNAVPKVIARGDGWFAMEYMEGLHNWKALLLAGDCCPEAAAAAGNTLRKIHDFTRQDEVVRASFSTLANFEQLRIEPYLITTGKRHPVLRDAFEQAASELRNASECLIHGDFSPKNLLVSSDHRRIVILDCEVAWFGDPAFDVAFFLNHLLLKALLHAPAEPGLRKLVESFHAAYRPDPALERRILRLLLLLMLARVDGKSPVEYLSPEKQNIVRSYCSPRIQTGQLPSTDDWFRFVQTHT